MVDFEQEAQKIEDWQKQQGWAVKDPFTHITNAELFIGFDDLLKKLYHFATLGKNYAVVYGQYGYGKTALIKKIAHEYGKKYNVILFEDVPSTEFVADRIKNLCPGKILRALGITKIDTHDYLKLNKAVKKKTILIFDEAHALDEKIFSYIRSLSENGNMFSVIFAGKPELVAGKKVIPQYLIDRIELSEGMRPLSEKESLNLVKKRIEVLSNSNNYLFNDDAIMKISMKSKYIPREILENCSKMIEFAIQNDIHEIKPDEVDIFFKMKHDSSVPNMYPTFGEFEQKITKGEKVVFEKESSKMSPSFEELAEKFGKGGSDGGDSEDEEEDEEFIAEGENTKRISTYEKIMEGSVPIHVPRASYNIERETLLNELSPSQKKIIVYLFENEPKTARGIGKAIDSTYDTTRHVLKRLQGKYDEVNIKKKISDLFPLIEEKKNPTGRGNVYFLSAQVRKVLSTD